MILQKQALGLLFYLFFSFLFAQNNPVEVIYLRVGQDIKGHASTLTYDNNIAYLSKESDQNQEFIDFDKGLIVDIIKYKNDIYKTVEDFKSLPKPTSSSETEKILGYICEKAVFKAFSNTIEVWYTTKAPAKGSPYKNYLPKDGLVLKIKINGNTRLIAGSIKEISKNTRLKYPYDKAIEISRSEYRELQIKSRYITIPVFDKQQINFESDISNQAFDQLNTTYRFSKGTVILKKISLPKINKEGASASVRVFYTF